MNTNQTIYWLVLGGGGAPGGRRAACHCTAWSRRYGAAITLASRPPYILTYLSTYVGKCLGSQTFPPLSSPFHPLFKPAAHTHATESNDLERINPAKIRLYNRKFRPLWLY